MADIVSLNKSIIQEAANCMRLAFLRVRDRDAKQDAERSAAEEIRLMYGIKVGEKAREQFPGGKLIQAENFSGMLNATQAALAAGDPILFEASFAFEGIGMKADVLRRLNNGDFDLIEVKSGTDPAGYLEDVAIQVWILQNLGIKARPFLMTLDKTATIKSKSLFQIIDCNQEVRKLLPEIENGLIKFAPASARELCLMSRSFADVAIAIISENACPTCRNIMFSRFIAGERKSTNFWIKAFLG